MDTVECLSFVTDTIQKVEIMVKLLKEVTCELYRFQSNNCQPNFKERNSVDDFIEKVTKTNLIPANSSLTSISNLLNQYLDNTICRKDSIMSFGSKANLSNRQVDSDNPINKGLLWPHVMMMCIIIYIFILYA